MKFLLFLIFFYAPLLSQIVPQGVNTTITAPTTKARVELDYVINNSAVCRVPLSQTADIRISDKTIAIQVCYRDMVGVQVSKDNLIFLYTLSNDDWCWDSNISSHITSCVTRQIGNWGIGVEVDDRLMIYGQWTKNHISISCGATKKEVLLGCTVGF